MTKENEWRIVYTRDGLKDKRRAFEAGFKDRILPLLDLLKMNPFAPYPPYEKLIGDLKGAYSRRINQQHRLVYRIEEEEHTVVILALWTHYE
jgi:Txe/YoeB family toxin of toxin-antitoxin system